MGLLMAVSGLVSTPRCAAASQGKQLVLQFAKACRRIVGLQSKWTETEIFGYAARNSFGFFAAAEQTSIMVEALFHPPKERAS
jgi:hypothetical protein